MSTSTEQYPDFSGMTFEKVWAALMENREQMKELREQIKETNRRIDEAEKRKKMNRQFRKTNLIIGRLGSRYGEEMETLVHPKVAKKFAELGYCFSGELHKLIINDPFTKQHQITFDVILENHELVIAVEIKINPCVEDIAHFTEQLQYYREFRNRLNPNDSRKIYGAIAAAVFPDNVQKVALDSGYYVIVPSGESIKIVVPEETELKAF